MEGSCQVLASSPQFANLILHGFCDASLKAYGACIYIVSKEKGGLAKSALLCAKSRVAPMKSKTLPRLELCSCVLLAQLSAKVQEMLALRFKSVFL